MERWWATFLERDFGVVQAERRIVKDTGRPGRMDLFAEDEDTIFVMEYKDSDWDGMKSPKHVRRNIRRYCLQLWSYMDSVEVHPDLTPHHKGMISFLVFSRKPLDEDRLAIIEEQCNGLMTRLVWMDEDPDWTGSTP
jgi:hypothetical protein